MSKNLLISDYDGTYINSSSNVVNINNEEIQKFIKNGNLFALSTGRIFSEIKKELDKYNIVLNYLCCSNGNSTFDGRYNLINYYKITEKDVEFLKKFYKYIDSIKTYNPYGDEADINVVEYRIKYKDIKAKKIITEYLLNNKIYSYYHNLNDKLLLHIFNYCKKKSDAINYIAKRENVCKNNIFTIGDGYNDQDMIINYNGFSVPNSNEYIKSISLKEYSSVANLANDISNGSVIRK